MVSAPPPITIGVGGGGGGGGDLRLKGRYIKNVGGGSEGFCGGHEIF